MTFELNYSFLTPFIAKTVQPQESPSVLDLINKADMDQFIEFSVAIFGYRCASLILMCETTPLTVWLQGAQ